MNVYISGDMEGVAGVGSWQQVDARTPHPEYATYRRYYTQEIAAAIAGARSAGATDILLNDSHGPMRNFDFDELPHDVRVIFGNRKPFSMVHGADAGFAGAMFVGYHGAIGDENAVLCHTYTPSVIYELRINETVCSEATINAGLLGHYGVPLLLITGDRTTVEGVQAQMPWVTGAIVKESIGNFATNSLSPTTARAMIRKAAAQAVANIANAKPYIVEPPIVLDITLAKTEQADLVAMVPQFERTGSRNIRFTTNDYPTAFKAFVAIFRLGATA